MIGIRGQALTAEDYRLLEARWIDTCAADRALIRRVSHLEGAELIGRNGAGRYDGLVFHHVWPGEDRVREYRLRLDHPPVESGKPKGKYLSAPGRGNLIYLPVGVDPQWLHDLNLPVLITEGEFKAIALHRLALHERRDGEDPRHLSVALSGVWNFRGSTGKTTDATGTRIDVKGPIADLNRIVWQARKVVIVFDRDLETNSSVCAARTGLTKELKSRGARVHWFVWPDEAKEAKGVDDLLAVIGPEKVLAIIDSAEPYNWHTMLIRSDKGKQLPVVANALIALRHAPEWDGVLSFNESSLTIVAQAQPPWGSKCSTPFTWTDEDDIQAAAWLQHQGIMAAVMTAGQSIQTVAGEHSYHPIRDYLNSLVWDKVPRIDSWLTTYLGVEPSNYSYAVGAKWLIGAVARVFRPGCKNDTCLILEGAQGTLKSTALKTLADPWFTDAMPELQSKDAALQNAGVWVIELGELDAMNRAEVSHIKVFMSRATDRFRPPYGRRAVDVPRQNVFSGTVNLSTYLRDETGGRRFWPVRCGTIDIAELKQDRDQLWAEAKERFDAGESWWLDKPAIIEAATAEQEERYEPGVWDELIATWISGRTSVSIEQILTFCIEKPKAQWNQADRNAVARSLRASHWTRRYTGPRGAREWRYHPPVFQSSECSSTCSSSENETGTPEPPENSGGY